MEKQARLTMIIVDKISKYFGDKPVVQQATTQFEKGKVTSIIGPNGAGKSTFISIISRILSKDEGAVLIDERELSNWDTKALAKRLSILRQANTISMRFTVREMITFGRFPHSRGKLTEQDTIEINKAIEYLDLEQIQHKYIDELSGGQRQLALIAMVICQDTDYVFLDEPLNNLDIKHSLQIMNNIRRLAQEFNKALIIVIHDINFATCYSDNIIAMKKGQIVAQGQVEEVIRSDVLEMIYETPFHIIEVEGKRICSYY